MDKTNRLQQHLSRGVSSSLFVPNLTSRHTIREENNMKHTSGKLAQLKSELEELSLSMPISWEAQRIKNAELFQLSKEIEELENPESYKLNSKHWE